MPLGFTFWGHIFNGSATALGLFLTFKLYDYGTKQRVLYLRILPFPIYVAIGALIPYINDAQHSEKHDMGSTIPVYILANDLYVFLFSLLVYRVVKSNKMKPVLLVALFAAFLLIHFILCVPTFPEFYWS